MKLIFLGSGSAFTVGADNFQSNMILTDDLGHKLLIDCGSDIRLSLHAAGFSYQDITDIYISHLHADHVGGLEYIGFSTKFDPRCPKPNLYTSADLADDLWECTLSGGMRAIEGEIANLNTYFNVHKIKKSAVSGSKPGDFLWQGIKFHLVKVVHVNNGYFVMPSYGLFFEMNGTQVFITTDTRISWEEMGEYYERADIIFHDCETSPFPTKVHAHYNDLVKLPAKIRSKIWLYGYQPGKLPDAQKDGFCGFVHRGQTFKSSDLVAAPEVRIAV